MNTCNNLPLYLYNEMDNNERMIFEDHLKHCSSCHASIATFNTLQNTKTIESLPLNVINDIFNETSRKKTFWNLSRTLKVSCAIAASMLIGIFTIPSSTPTLNQHPHPSYFDIAPVGYEEIAGIGSDINEFDPVYNHHGVV